MTVTGPRGSYDAVLLVSFGGPEGPDDVVPYLENVTRGRGIPRERLVEVGAHYTFFGGVSPINAQTRALLDAIRADLADHGADVPVYWGNRNWHPYLAETLRAMRDDGITSAACFVTSAYSSYSGCRQYRENLFDAVAQVEADGRGAAPRLDKLRHYFDHPGFVGTMVDHVVDAAVRVGVDRPRLVFTTHSIPLSSAAASGPDGDAYVAQHREVARLVHEAVSARVDVEPEWDLVYQSRSGPPQVPWLEPDISDHLTAVRGTSTEGVVIVPLGFVSDHMEVLWDLDTVALDHARAIGLPASRAGTVGTDPRFVAVVRDLLLERVGLAPARALSPLGPSHDVCPGTCCPNPRGERPALCEAPR
ncbi:MAG TPA: ferrochelatase [Candidatus Nanopelagicales bacterium]|nr:ferrochelatase [Candidatus Nanopelagicales bacterium]